MKRRTVSVEKIGWLKNPARKERRDQPYTLTDSHVMELLKKIEEMPKYTKRGGNYEKLLRIRDSALIALTWIFFKRGGEVLRTRLRDIYYNERELSITFRIEKKARRIKICPKCREKNSFKASFCKKCGEPIANVKVTLIGQKSFVVTKHMTMRNPFCKYVVKWLETAKKLGCPQDGFIFAPYHFQSGSFLWKTPITIQRFDQILQALDPTLTSCMFRYGGSEKYLRLGYTVFELMEIGDWSTSRMPEIYAKRKGLTASQKKFSEDTRMI